MRTILKQNHFGLATATLLFGCMAFAQAPNPTQTNIPDTADGPYPVFRVTAVSRSVKAINYHHRNGSTVLGFAGTSYAPKAKGEARVESKTGATKVDVNFDKLPPPQVFGNEYLTYVLWAITPEGRATNMGEVYLDGEKAKLMATTELQAFGMIVTAEPYYAVTQPSDMVILENVIVNKNSGSTSGTIGPIETKFELLQKGSYNAYLPKADRNLTKDDRSDSPLDLKEARFALAIASTLGARQYANDTMKKADVELLNAESFWKSTKDKKKVQTLARNVTQLAEDARLITVRLRNEEEAENQRKAQEARVAAANAEAESQTALRQQADAQKLRADQERERARLAEAQATAAALAAKNDALEQQREAEAARQRAEVAKAEAERARLSVIESQKQLEEQRVAAMLERQKLEAEQLRMKALADAAEAGRLKAEMEKQQLRDELRRQFNLILETRDTARGLIVNMSDVLFDTGKYTLRPAAREKLSKISGIVLAHPGLKLEVEGHTDSVGSEEMNQVLSEKRASGVRDYLIKQGLNESSVTSKGFGKTMPVADNATAAGRQQNRRVEMVVSGAIIERTSTATPTQN